MNDTLYPFQRRLTELRTQVQAELDGIGKLDLPGDKCHTVLDIIQKFCDAFKAEIHGKCRDIDTSRQYAKERISFVFRETFAKGLLSIDPLHDITNEQILNAIVNSRGLESSMVLPEVKFQYNMTRNYNLYEYIFHAERRYAYLAYMHSRAPQKQKSHTNMEWLQNCNVVSGPKYHFLSNDALLLLL
jgi:hypothetical protein